MYAFTTITLYGPSLYTADTRSRKASLRIQGYFETRRQRGTYACVREGVCGWAGVMCVCVGCFVWVGVCGVSVGGCGCVGYSIFIQIILITVGMVSTTSLTLRSVYLPLLARSSDRTEQKTTA